MKVLVIHPDDRSTDFLDVIYKDHINWTVIRTGVGYGLTKKKLKSLIIEHDVIMMLGHGTEQGLMRSDFTAVIDSSYVYLLREKLTVGIWCNADQFYKKYELTGLGTGMIISEYQEANLFCVNADYSAIDKSNHAFARAIKDNLDLSNIQKSVIGAKRDYVVINEVTQFNNENIYSFEKGIS